MPTSLFSQFQIIHAVSLMAFLINISPFCWILVLVIGSVSHIAVNLKDLYDNLISMGFELGRIYKVRRESFMNAVLDVNFDRKMTTA